MHTGAVSTYGERFTGTGIREAPKQVPAEARSPRRVALMLLKKYNPLEFEGSHTLKS
jgi:hypothetical protein